MCVGRLWRMSASRESGSSGDLRVGDIGFYAFEGRCRLIVWVPTTGGHESRFGVTAYPQIVGFAPKWFFVPRTREPPSRAPCCSTSAGNDGPPDQLRRSKRGDMTSILAPVSFFGEGRKRRSDPASPRLTDPLPAAVTTSPLSDMFHHSIVCG
jgi:hypothetical protein